jgi:type VI secretion system protein ImpA
MSGRWQGQDLLQPITNEQPCGQDLEDTHLLASFDAFRLFGQQSPLDPQPEWGDIKNKALEALAQSKDVRLLTHLGAAALRTDGFAGFADTLTAAAGWLDAYWADVYPRVDEDAIVRRNALNCFADPMAIVDAVRRMPLVASRQHGIFSLRDLDIVSGQLQPAAGEAAPDEARIDAAFMEMALADLQALQESVTAALTALKGIDATMATRGGDDAVPQFEPLSAQLVKIDRAVRTRLAARGDATADAGAAAGDAPAAAGGTVAVGAIASRQDAIRALDAVAEFFRRNEPSSPIPMFLERAKRLVSKSFLEVLADIAPDAVSQAMLAGGVTEARSE